MERAIDELRRDIEHFLGELKSKRQAYKTSLERDDILANTKQILHEIRQLESAIVAVVEEHLKQQNSPQ